ncbi:MAG: endonuclease MutS2 [Candidatus Sumerlaeia bacterium]
MDKITFDRLEFPLVLQRLAELATSPAARQAIATTHPSSDESEINRHYDAVMEILGVLDRGGSIPLSGFDDCSEIIARLEKPQGFLEASAWLSLRVFLEKCSDIRKQIKNSREQMPVTWARIEKIDPLFDLSSQIREIFTDEGTVRDSASPELRSCRQRMKRLEREIEKIRARILGQMSDAGALQDSYWTERNGRMVIPVRAGSRGKAKGIVHDSSNTGETLFIEPLELVEPGNHYSEELRREQEIIYRILVELADRVRPYCTDLAANRDAMVQLDLWLARAQLAYRHGLHRPSIDSSRPIHLIEAHHPLIYFSDPGHSIPLDLKLLPENKVLIITGPNTGGKTTSLKTVGLLAMMAQSAIPIPAAVDSRLPVFPQILAEMGDDQSVTAGLSTFSAHIRRVSTILENCGHNALVLLDELGKATDPLQAGALGRAILEALISRDVLTLVTTHLPTLKDWAHDSAAGRNASFRLDPRSHRPQYRLQLDTPGISEAFTIARAEGLPDEIVEAAKTALPKEEREMMELLSALHDKEAILQREIRKAHEARQKADADRRALHKQKAQVDRRKTDADLKLEQEYKKLLDKARQDLEKRIANLPSRKALSQAREELARDQKHAEKRIEQMRQREEEILQQVEAPQKKEEPEEDYEPQEGDWVSLGKGGQQGRIESIDKDRKRAKILIGKMQVDARLSALLPAEAPEEPEARYNSYRYLSGGPLETVPAELNLLGKRVEEALDAVDRYLDRAVMSQHDKVRIIHGYGTGALRDAIGQHLRGHPLVKSSKLADPEDGGMAVTIASLR